MGSAVVLWRRMFRVQFNRPRMMRRIKGIDRTNKGRIIYQIVPTPPALQVRMIVSGWNVKLIPLG